MPKPEEFEFNERDLAFERQLAAAMKRVDAPARLSVSLMNIAEAEAPKPVVAAARNNKLFTFRWMPASRLWLGGALATVLTVGVFAGEAIHVHREHERAEAEKQFDEAQQITDRAIEHAREELERRGISIQE